MNWLDMIIIVILAVSGISGFFTGMILVLTHSISIIIGLMVAYNYYKPVVNYMSNNWNLIDKLSFWISPCLQQINSLSMLNKTKILELSKILSISVIEILTFLSLLFIITRIIQWGGLIISGLMTVSLLGPLNHAGGLVLGIIRGLLIAAVLLTLLAPFNIYLGTLWRDSRFGYQLLEAWNTSIFVPYFKLFLKFIADFIPGLPLNKNFNQYLSII